MLCLKVDAASSSIRRRRRNSNNNEEESAFPSFDTIGNTIRRCIIRGKRTTTTNTTTTATAHWIADSSSCSNATGTSSSGLDVIMDQIIHQDALPQLRLQQEIITLQKQLQQEIDLNFALASATDNSALRFSIPLSQLPDKAQDILADIDVLEITVSKLEEELDALQFQLCQERNERRLAEYRLRQLPSSSPSTLAYSPVSPEEQVARTSKKNAQVTTLDDLLFQTDVTDPNKDTYLETLRQEPNKLSEEMVRCMRNILLCVDDSSKFSSSGFLASPASPQGHLSYSSIASLSDSSTIPASKQSLSSDSEHVVLVKENAFDPYRVQGKLNWTKYIGTYTKAVEVCRISVGEKQLKYAAEALKRFRLLVEQLAKVNPISMNTNERLAFWINLYNTLIMHGYLAYGVPGSDSKFFSLTKKSAYTVGGISVSAADIEFIILKMRPAHRPQLALGHKFKLFEEKKKYSIENSEPLLAFALSCGMHSSPAVRIFRPANVLAELKNSLKDYIQASVGISSKGKLLVPKLLHCYSKGIIEDSMLPDWICRFLSFEQAAMVRDCSSPRKQRLTSPRGFTVQSFDSTFRYLFLLENEHGE